MDAVNQDDEGMMAMMGIAGFGSTKVRMLTVGGMLAPENSITGKAR